MAAQKTKTKVSGLSKAMSKKTFYHQKSPSTLENRSLMHNAIYTTAGSHVIIS